MKVRVAAILGLFSVLGDVATGAQTQRALLIGINIYQPAGTNAEHPAGCIYGRCELGTFQNLDGAVNDARAMADLLTSPKFGFPAANVALLTNPFSRRHVAASRSCPPTNPPMTESSPRCRNTSWTFPSGATRLSFTTPATAHCA